MLKFKEYLGDAVYAAFDGWNVILTTEDGVRETNTIVMEPEVLHAFSQWHQRLKDRKIADASDTTP